MTDLILSSPENGTCVRLLIRLEHALAVDAKCQILIVLACKAIARRGKLNVHRKGNGRMHSSGCGNSARSQIKDRNTGNGAYPYLHLSLKQRVDERRDRWDLGNNHSEQSHYDQHGHEPQFFVLAQEGAKLNNEAAHLNTSASGYTYFNKWLYQGEGKRKSGNRLCLHVFLLFIGKTSDEPFRRKCCLFKVVGKVACVRSRHPSVSYLTPKRVS
jgi:hypothetical protein